MMKSNHAMIEQIQSPNLTLLKLTGSAGFDLDSFKIFKDCLSSSVMSQVEVNTALNTKHALKLIKVDKS